MPFEPWFWENLCKAIRHPDLIQEFHKPETIQILNKVFQSKSKSEWESILKQIDIPWAPLNTLEEALKHPQVIHRKFRIPIKSIFNIHLVYKRISSYMLFMVLEATAVKHLMLISNTKNASA
jgi:crotonobetainyl-CoA:carnitine CoA-transferase CaiB-like acyl-CoA transferase